MALMLAMAQAPAHPRACGENGGARRVLFRGEGSSPRVRGKREARDVPRRRFRLIPARAGKTLRSTTTSCPTAAHPRACGENGGRGRLGLRPGGSSPRVRGKRYDPHDPHRQRGLIPARAGKTVVERPDDVLAQAHPRACGENWERVRVPVPVLGSSPRVRGKRAPTPASCPPRPAHPRACGENESSAAAKGISQGSSPRVRGKRFLTWAFTAQAGRILETLEPSAFSGSYSFPGVRANGGRCRAHRRGLCTGPALGRPLGAS